MPFSTISGVLFRSCDPSVGAMFVARVLTILCPNLAMEKRVIQVLVDEFVLRRSCSVDCDVHGFSGGS